MKINQKVLNEIVREAVKIRRDIHQHPETAFKEKRTAGVIADYLTSCGITVETGIAKTGVVGTLKGNGKSRKVIGLRADMDALEMKEESGLPYQSVYENSAHACGHDGHVAILLAAAKVLSRNRKSVKGTVKFFFQPAEEGPLGAKVMVNHPAWKKHKPDMMFGLHSWVGIQLGKAGIIPGPIMAAGGGFTVKIKGKGGHAAMPHLAKDPVNAAVQCIQGVNTIVSREIYAMDPAVISVTNVHAGTVFNIIPDEAVFGGTFRSLRLAVQQDLAARIKRVITATAKAHGCTAHIRFDAMFPPTVNDGQATALCVKTAERVLGKRKVSTDIKPVMGSEDFAFFAQEVPAAFLFLGTGPSKYGHHHPAHDFNDKAVSVGCKYWVSLVDEYFK